MMPGMNDAGESPPNIPLDPAEPRPSVLGALGGPLGIAESVLPLVTYISAYTVLQSPATSAWIALAVGGVLALARILRGQTVQYAIAGVFGVGLAALIVSRTGRAEDFFVPGLLANAGYALGCTVSIAVRYPAVGLAVGMMRGEGTGWRADRARVRIYARATWIWVTIFSLRLAVQFPLYLAGAVVALGTARVVMGLPIFGLGLWLTWLMLRAFERDADEGTRA